MTPWLEIDSDPPRAYYTQTKPALDLAYPLLVGVGAVRHPLSIPGISSGETGNLRVTLDNAKGQITAHYGSNPPLRTIARVMSGVGVLFEGTITAVTLGTESGIQIEAGAFRPLSDPLPLRNTTVWGAYKDVRTIPWAYGRVTLTPIQYDQQGRLFVLADHPIQGVARVERDDAETDAWAFYNELDSTGHAVSMLELAEPLAQGESLAVSILGRMDAEVGGLIDQPARILWDLLNNLAGVEIAWSEFDSFRVETDGIRLGGLIDDAQVTARATIDEIMQSVGAAWSAGMPGVAAVWPSAIDTDAPALPVNRQTADDISPESSHAGLVTVLRVLYDYDHAIGTHRRAIQLEAPDQIRKYGRIESEWGAGWLRSPRIAETLGRRMLRYLSRPRWGVTWDQQFAQIKPGSWVELDHPQIPATGRHRLISAEMDYIESRLTCSVDIPVGDIPTVETTALSTAFEPIVGSGAAVEYNNGIATFTIRDDTGRPLSGAKATLNGTTTRLADNAGRVSFEVPRGSHVLYVEATGYALMEIEVTV